MIPWWWLLAAVALLLVGFGLLLFLVGGESEEWKARDNLHVLPDQGSAYARQAVADLKTTQLDGVYTMKWPTVKSPVDKATDPWEDDPAS